MNLMMPFDEFMDNCKTELQGGAGDFVSNTIKQRHIQGLPHDLCEISNVFLFNF